MLLTILILILVTGHLGFTTYREWRDWRSKQAQATASVTSPQAIEDAVRAAFSGLGLPSEQFGPGFDLAATGKVYELLHHAATTLDKDHELRTVGDVVAWLNEAPTGAR